MNSEQTNEPKDLPTISQGESLADGKSGGMAMPDPRLPRQNRLNILRVSRVIRKDDPDNLLPPDSNKN